MSYTKVLVIGIVIMTILFTATVLIMMKDGMDEPATLVKCWFGGFVSELLACAGIKISKVCKQKTDEEEEEPVG